jgi:hypothetical protein
VLNLDIQSAQGVLADLTKTEAFVKNPLPFLTVWGNAVGKEARETARSKGGRQFWHEIAQSTRVQTVSATGVSVHSTHIAARQKQYGGRISAPGKGPSATGSQWLTIPLVEEAKRKRAREFELGGRELFVPLGTHVLGYVEKRGKGKGTFHALYALVKSVTQAAEPWFPEPERAWQLGAGEAQRWLERALAKGGPAA